MNKKIILEVMGARSTKYGGLELFMYELAKNDKENEYHLIYNEFPYSEQYINDLRNVGVHLHVIDVRGSGIFTNIVTFYSLLKAIRPDIVHFHFSNAYAFWGPLCKFMHVKKIFKTIHGCLFYNGKQAESISDMSIRHRIMTRGGRIFKIFNCVVCVSEFVYNQQLKVYGNYDNAKVIYLGTPPPKRLYENECKELKLELGINNLQKVILTIMFASPEKGCDILINALPRIKGDYVLLIIGMDENREYTKKMHHLSEKLGVENKIVWIGITSEVFKYMSISDIYVQPSRTDALPLAAVEAKSFKLPVVATETGGLPEVANKMFNYEDSKALADCLSELIINDEEYRIHSRASYQRWIESFNVENGIKKHIELYNDEY